MPEYAAPLKDMQFVLKHLVGLDQVNTLPGFTTISLYSKMWAASGVPYGELLDRLIALALERHGSRQQLRTSVT